MTIGKNKMSFIIQHIIEKLVFIVYLCMWEKSKK